MGSILSSFISRDSISISRPPTTITYRAPMMKRMLPIDFFVFIFAISLRRADTVTQSHAAHFGGTLG
jgi:hypothetical protein